MIKFYSVSQYTQLDFQWSYLSSWLSIFVFDKFKDYDLRSYLIIELLCLREIKLCINYTMMKSLKDYVCYDSAILTSIFQRRSFLSSFVFPCTYLYFFCHNCNSNRMDILLLEYKFLNYFLAIF